MFADNDRDAKAAFNRWLWQGPSAPYNADLLGDLPQHQKEIIEYLASFVFHEGEKFGRLCAGIEKDGERMISMITAQNPPSHPLDDRKA